MGCFSWKTQDTNESIPIESSNRKTFTVYMMDNKGNIWEENNYEGYGVFGGKDFYDILAEMNGKTNRDEGIDLSFSDKEFLSPNLYRSKNNTWKNEAPSICEYQGLFYPEDVEEEEDEDY